MARTGRFGRQPRAAQNLTSTIVAIAREYQNQRAQNIMDAWQKGGMFENKKATDEVVLKFWADKAKGVSKDDPLYDTYRNAHTQLDYTIHESKMTAKYAQGHATDAEMVSFYMNWAKKVPKNSEFYRVLQRDAGQYMRNSKAASDAAARKAAEDRYQRQQAETRKQEAPGEYLVDTFRRLAQSGNADAGIAPAINAPGSGSDLTDFDPSDPDRMLRLIALIDPMQMNTSTRELPGGGTAGPASEQVSTPTGKYAGSNKVLYHDDNGKPVTGADIVKTLMQKDPHWKPGQPLNVDYVTKMLGQQIHAIDERMDRAQKTGHMTDYVNLQKSKGYVALLNREVAAYPVQTAYNDAKQDYERVMNDPSASPQAMANAWSAFQSTLIKLSNDKRIEADDNMRSRLVAEANGDGSVHSLGESFTGLNGGGAPKDIADNAVTIERIHQQIEQVKSGAAVWTYGEVNDAGVFTPKAGGRTIGAGTVDGIKAGGDQMTTVTVPDPRGGQDITMTVTAVPIYATATNPLTNEPMDVNKGNQPIGYAYTFPSGSGVQTKYGFQTKQGFVYSYDPPWDSSLHPTASSSGGNHLTVDLTPVIEQTLFGGRGPDGQLRHMPDLSKDQDLGFGVSIKGAKAKGPRGAEATPGTFVLDPLAAAYQSSTRATLGDKGLDPATDFKSLTLSLLMGDEEGRRILSDLDHHPEYKRQLDYDNHVANGYYRDPKTGAWVAGANADPVGLGKSNAQQAIAQAGGGFVDFVYGARDLWTKDTTGTPFSASGMDANKQKDDMFQPLPSDSVRSIGSEWGALGNAYLPGTNVLSGPQSPGGNAPAIAPVGTLKVPTYMVPGPSAPTASTPGYTPPAATTPVAQPTYTPPSGTTQQTYQPPPGQTSSTDQLHPSYGGNQQY